MHAWQLGFCWRKRDALAMMRPLINSGRRRDPAITGRRRRNTPGNAQAEGLCTL